jgi:pilus assembly protein CpaE
MERVITYLRSRYEYVLVDSDTQYTTLISPLIGACEEMSLVCTPDVASLRDMTRHIEHLSLTDGFASKLRVIVNRASSEAAVTADQIEAAVRFPVSEEIPNNYAELVKSINAGEPIGPQTRGGFTQAIGRWANRLASMTEFAQPEAPAKKRFGLW